MTPAPTIHALAVSDGGVPKLAITAAHVGPEGLVGDRQADRKHHGGPERALCLLGLDVIERLLAEGHPVSPGSTGENLTLAGLDWTELKQGDRLLFEGGVELTVTTPAVPCSTIAGSFRDGEFRRMHSEVHPGDARLYTRVLRTGRLTVGETFRVVSAD